MPKGKVNTTVTLVTFGLFMTEAILHYNMGVQRETHDKKFVMPPTRDFVKLAAVVGTFSILNGYIVNQLTTS